jgi:hypothetical protein
LASFVSSIATLQPATETAWQEIISDTGDFSVLMPSEPEEILNESPAGTSFASLPIFVVDFLIPSSGYQRFFKFT